MIQQPFHRLEIPTGKMCAENNFSFSWINCCRQISVMAIMKPMFRCSQKNSRAIPKEEVLKRVAALEFDRFLKYYENAEDLNARDQRSDGRMPAGRDGRDGRPKDRYRKQETTEDYTRLFVNLGTKDGFYKASFLQFILDMSDLRKDVLGKIDMKEMNTWVEVERKAAKQMIRSLDGKNYKGRRIRMNEANSR
jgi:ATP-dependent RNA helicase DeaD